MEKHFFFLGFAELKRCEVKDEDDRRKGDYFQLQVLAFSFVTDACCIMLCVSDVRKCCWCVNEG